MAQKGTGLAITFSSGFFAEILDGNWEGISREAIKTSHMGTTGGHTYIPADLNEPGQLSVDIAWAPETSPPIQGAAETVTVSAQSAGTGGTSTWAASGFLVEMGVAMPFEERMTAACTLQMSGNITVTP